MDSLDPELVDAVHEVVAVVRAIEAVERVKIRWVSHELRAAAEAVSDCDLTLAEAHAIAEGGHHRLLLARR